MKTTRKLLVFAMAAMTLSACQKENINNNVLIIEAEGMHNGSKLAIAGNASHWAAGDQVLINGGTYTVDVSVDGQTTVDLSGSPLTAPFYGVYPADICLGDDGGSVYDFSLSNEYQYYTCTDGGVTRQNLQSPMVAYAASGNKLTFKHLTAAVTVEITNNYGFAVKVKKIEVESDKYNLWDGMLSLDLSDPIDVTATTAASESNKKVTMKFDYTPLKIDQGATAQVQIPVLPVGADNHFTINVTVEKDGDASVAKTYTKSQEGDGSRALGRAQIGYAPMPVGFTFNIGASQKAIISQGNLQAVTTDSWSSYTWKFAANQYDVVESANVSTDYAGSSTVSLFGYGTSGYNNGQTYYQPYCTGYSVYTDYLCSSLDGTEDWGYNAITNGGNVVNYGWRTPTATEGDYLFANNTNGLATIDGTHTGIVILPNGWILPGECSFTAGYGSGYTTNTYTIAQWRKMEANGAIFFPWTGYRSGTSYNDAPANYIDYWTATFVGVYSSSVMHYDVNGGGYQGSANRDKSKGYPVRLIKNVD